MYSHVLGCYLFVYGLCIKKEKKKKIEVEKAKNMRKRQMKNPGMG